MRNALVTGGAAGIGRAVVEEFLRAGWRVGAYDIDVSGLDDLLAQHGEGRLVVGALDVRDSDAWQRALADFCGDGALDLLVNNAGILQAGQFADLPLDAQLRTIDVNVKGALIGCHAAYPYLKRSAAPQVINIASASAIYGQVELATYSASKFAVRGLSEALDLEWASQGIRVQAVWPLFVRTAMTDGLDIGTSRALGIRLTPQQVARQVRKAVESPNADRLSIHRSVGWSARASMLGAAVSPSWVLRRVNARLASR